MIKRENNSQHSFFSWRCIWHNLDFSCYNIVAYLGILVIYIVSCNCGHQLYYKAQSSLMQDLNLDVEVDCIIISLIVLCQNVVQICDKCFPKVLGLIFNKDKFLHFTESSYIYVWEAIIQNRDPETSDRIYRVYDRLTDREGSCPRVYKTGNVTISIILVIIRLYCEQ